MDNIETRLKALEYELSQIVDSDYLNELNKYPNQNLRKDIIINIIPSRDISFKTRTLLSDILDRLELTRQDRQDLEKYIIYGGGENIEYIKSTIGDLLSKVPDLNYLIDNIQTVIPLLNKLDELFKDTDESLDSFKELYNTLNSLKTSINNLNTTHNNDIKKINNTLTYINDTINEIDGAIQNHVLLKKDSPFEKGDAENSAVLKGEYEGYSNKAISQTSMAVGAATTAGLKGWYYSAIDFTNKKITLSDRPTYILAGNLLLNGGWSSGVPNIKVDDVISLVNNSKYDLCSKVTAVNGNVITVDSLPFTILVRDEGAAVALIAGQFSDGYSVYIPDRPDAGIIDFGGGAFSEGGQSMATNICAHAEGLQTHAYGQYSHTEGRETKAGYIAHAEGSKTKAIGNASHAEGTNTQALNSNTHAEGYNTEVKGYAGHAEGYLTKVLADYGHAEGENTEVSTFSRGAHAEGVQTKASNTASHAEGCATKALGTSSHAEGQGESLDNPNLAQGDYSHVEGEKNKALGIAAHSEGGATVATGNFSHSEGRFTRAHGLWSHVEGGGVEGDEDNYGAFGPISHCEGYATKTYSSANSAHVEGRFTEANNMAEHACGIYNKSTKSSDASQATHFSIGIGSSNTNRKNAFEVKQNSDVYITGIGGYDGTNAVTANAQGIIAKSVQEVINELVNKLNEITTND